MISYSQYEFDNRVHRYAESLIRKGDDVDVICLGSKGQLRHEVVNGVSLHRIQMRDYNENRSLSYLMKLLFFFFRSAFICTILQFEKRFDIHHFHNIPDFGIFCTLIPKLCGAKVILDVHDLVPEFYQRKFHIGVRHPVVRILNLIEKMAAYYADHVITVTTIWQDTLVKRSVSKTKCSVILNAPDPRLFYRCPVKRKDGNTHFNLVYHGNLSEIFGVDIAIKSMRIIQKSVPHAELHIYGQGRNKEKLIQLANSLCLNHSVVFHKPVTRNEIPDILRHADIGIDPKRDGVLAGEGLSSKCMEYLAVGLPAVVSKIKAAQTYYHESMVAFFEPYNECDLARSI
ncbi:glycosyltransferase family 4 protein, partial [bacterium]|nr:glycosyltransferase family 4 protein [bacterium]